MHLTHVSRHGLAGLLGGLFALTGCYKADFSGPGGFKCQSGKCPSGYTCSAGVCVKNGQTAVDRGAEAAIADRSRTDLPRTDQRVDAGPALACSAPDTADSPITSNLSGGTFGFVRDTVTGTLHAAYGQQTGATNDVVVSSKPTGVASWKTESLGVPITGVLRHAALSAHGGVVVVAHTSNKNAGARLRLVGTAAALDTVDAVGQSDLSLARSRAAATPDRYILAYQPEAQTPPNIRVQGFRINSAGGGSIKAEGPATQLAAVAAGADQSGLVPTVLIDDNNNSTLLFFSRVALANYALERAAATGAGGAWSMGSAGAGGPLLLGAALDYTPGTLYAISPAIDVTSKEQVLLFSTNVLKSAVINPGGQNALGAYRPALAVGQNRVVVAYLVSGRVLRVTSRSATSNWDSALTLVPAGVDDVQIAAGALSSAGQSFEVVFRRGTSLFQRTVVCK